MKNRRVRLGGIYQYTPVFFDQYQQNTKDLPHGCRLRVIQPKGTPANGTMGMAYTETLDGKFIGLVCINSLERL